eukprot:11186235-Lingulodinium_polyedra.AAC.1
MRVAAPRNDGGARAIWPVGGPRAARPAAAGSLPAVPGPTVEAPQPMPPEPARVVMGAGGRSGRLVCRDLRP